MPNYIEGKNEVDPIEFINLYVNNSIVCEKPNGDFNNFKGNILTFGKPINLTIRKKFDFIKI